MGHAQTPDCEAAVWVGGIGPHLHIVLHFFFFLHHLKWEKGSPMLKRRDSGALPAAAILARLPVEIGWPIVPMERECRLVGPWLLKSACSKSFQLLMGGISGIERTEPWRLGRPSLPSSIVSPARFWPLRMLRTLLSRTPGSEAASAVVAVVAVEPKLLLWAKLRLESPAERLPWRLLRLAVGGRLPLSLRLLLAGWRLLRESTVLLA